VTNEQGVVERFGVVPSLIPSLFALVGDVSDRIPGLPGFGLKSAGALLRRWGSLEAIPDDPEAWDCRVRGATRLAKVLRERRREALLYRNLSRLRDDLPLVDTLDDLRWRGARRSELEPLAERLEVTEALEKVRIWRVTEPGAGPPGA
jgi:5'-3' exonuclease